MSDSLRKLQGIAARFEDCGEFGSELYAIATKAPIETSRFLSRLSALSIQSVIGFRGRRVSGKFCALIAFSADNVLHLFAHGMDLAVLARPL